MVAHRILPPCAHDPVSEAVARGASRLLWSLKRVEHGLSQTWQLLNGMQRQLRGLAALQRELGLECPGVGAVWVQLRNCLSMRSEMAHFCTNLQVGGSCASAPPCPLPHASQRIDCCIATAFRNHPG